MSTNAFTRPISGLSANRDEKQNQLGLAIRHRRWLCGVLTKSFKKWPLLLYLNLQRASFRYAFGLRRLYKSFMRINTHTHALGSNTNSLRVKMAAKFGVIQTVYINLEYKYLMLLPLRRVSTLLWTKMRKRNDHGLAGCKSLCCNTRSRNGIGGKCTCIRASGEWLPRFGLARS